MTADFEQVSGERNSSSRPTNSSNNSSDHHPSSSSSSSQNFNSSADSVASALPAHATQANIASPSVRYSVARHANHMEESPDLLRWRADLLLDEMMMGAVDVSAADGGMARPQPGHSPAAGTPAHRATPGEVAGTSASESPSYSGKSYISPRYDELDNRPAPTVNSRDDVGRADAGRYDPNQYEIGRFDSEPFEPERGEATDLSHSGGSPATHPTPAAYPTGQVGYGNQGYDERGYPLRYAEPERPRGEYPRDEQAPPESYNRPLPPVRTRNEPTLPAGNENSPRTDRLYDVEQQYEQYRREQSNNIQPVTPAPLSSTQLPPAAPSMTSPAMTSSAPPAANARPAPPDPEPDVHTQWAHTPEKWLRQDFNPVAEPVVEEPPANYGGAMPRDPNGRDGSGYAMMDRVDIGDSAVRQDPALFVNAMAVMSHNKRRSNLLPRMSTMDVDALNREIASLHGEITQLLPIGHESSERARHLLDKAYTILQSDPMRSAEVEYYMQQVRTIVQRLHQSRQWSGHYHDKLRVYLLGWLSFSAILFAARYLFQLQFDAFLAGLFGLAPDSLLLAHWTPFLGAAFAGALGGAIGALYTMRRQNIVEYGFYDRKYGLRGLMLPIIGLIVGLVSYLLFAILFTIAGINPAANIVAGAIPALAAFAFGFSQESIYGTRA